MNIEAFSKTKKICLILSVLNLIATSAVIFILPQTAGNDDSIKSRMMLLMFPAIIILFNLVYSFMIKRKQNDKTNYAAIAKIYFIVEITYLVISIAVVWLYFNNSDKDSYSIYRYIITLIAYAGLVFIGNYRPQVRQCCGVGIKIPWTKDNEKCWHKTNRFIGRIITGLGLTGLLLTVISIITGKIPVNCLILYMFIGAFLTYAAAIIYAYRHRND